MKRQLIFGTMLSATLAVGVAAQQPPASGSTPPAGQPPSDRPSASQSMTLTGCLKEAPSGGAATAPGGATAGASQARGGFILTDAKPAGSMAGGATAPGAATGTSGAGAATGTTGSASAQSTYRLTGGDNLQQYVGQKVELTGTATSGASSASPSSPGAAASPGAEKPASGSGQGPALRVTTVRPTGDKCN
jgi:hypothetical protein